MDHPFDNPLISNMKISMTRKNCIAIFNCHSTVLRMNTQYLIKNDNDLWHWPSHHCSIVCGTLPCFSQLCTSTVLHQRLEQRWCCRSFHQSGPQDQRSVCLCTSRTPNQRKHPTHMSDSLSLLWGAGGLDLMWVWALMLKRMKQSHCQTQTHTQTHIQTQQWGNERSASKWTCHYGSIIRGAGALKKSF